MIFILMTITNILILKLGIIILKNIKMRYGDSEIWIYLVITKFITNYKK